LSAAAAAGPGGSAPAAGRVEAVLTGEWSGTLAHQEAAGVSRTLGVLAGRLTFELYPAVAPWRAVATVEPRVVADLGSTGQGTTLSVAGTELAATDLVVTEAYAAFRFPAADLWVGRFPLPLETARLTLPFTMTPYDEAGRRPGSDGVRADVYFPSGRLHLAAVRQRDRWTPLIGWRQQLAGWEATAYVLSRGEGLAVGAGASGLVGSTVVYGEAWRLPGEDGLRGTVGATWYWREMLWTAELARAGFPSAGAPGSGATPMLQAAFQLAYAPRPGWTVTGHAAVVLEPNPPGAGGAKSSLERPHRLGGSVTYELVPGRAELELSASRWVWPLHPMVLGVSLALRWFF